MGALINEGLDIKAQELADSGTILDDEGNIIDAKTLLKAGLVKQFNVTKRIYERMSEGQKVRFSELTEIDEGDIEEYDGEDHFEPGSTCLGSLANADAAEALLNDL